MTAITIWRNDEVPNHPSLWVAADSRVTTQQGSVLVEDAAKVLGLPVVCRAPDQDGFFTDVYHSHYFGYCFAGSTLIGQNAYLGLVPLLGNLVSPHRYVPSLSDVATHMLSYLRKAFDDFKVRAGESAMFEAALIGSCPNSGSLGVFHFRPEMVEGVFKVALTPYTDLEDGDFVYLGDKRENVTGAIAAARAKPSEPGRPKSRYPRYVIQDFIDDSDFQTIGGDIQLAIVDDAGFRPFLLCKPRIKGDAPAYFSYLGRELTDDIRIVGQAIVGGPGMV
ncbi:hypothetical protein C9993_01400 [Marinobacter sp. Z-F4-2]|nr:hypothetical protein C9993_01400 [Marinobacter sp. Z-F4-2]